MDGLGSRQRSEMAHSEVAPADPPGAETGGPVDLGHHVAAPLGGLARKLERLPIVADGEVGAGNRPPREIDLDPIGQFADRGQLELQGGLSGLAPVDQLVDRVLPCAHQRRLVGRALARAAIGDFGHLLAFLAGAAEIAGHGLLRRWRAGRPALERQAVDGVRIRVITVPLEPGAQLLVSRAVGVRVHVALPLDMAEQQRIVQPADQGIGRIKARFFLQRDDLAIETLIVGAEGRQAVIAPDRAELQRQRCGARGSRPYDQNQQRGRPAQRMAYTRSPPI
jgi:hypothetical protein